MNKKIRWGLAAVVLVLAAVVLAGCGGLLKSEAGGDAVALMPEYIGEGTDDPFYTFTMDDLKVNIIYNDGLTAELTEEYTIRTETEGGYFTVFVEWKGLSGDIMIPIGAENWQNYRAERDAARTEIAESIAAEQESLEAAIAEAQAKNETAAE